MLCLCSGVLSVSDMKRRLLPILIFITLLGVALPVFGQRSLDDVVTTSSPASSLEFYHPEEFDGLIDRLAVDGETYLNDIQGELGLESLPVVDVWVLRRVADYYSLHGLENRAPKWAAGLSFSNQARIILVNGSGAAGERIDIDATFRHELAHVAMDVASGNRGVPRWFNEGFAIMHASEWTADRSTLLSQAAAGGSLTPFEQLERSFPAHHNSASLAYAQSFHFVRSMKTRYGEDVYSRILERIRENGTSFNDAFAAVTGESIRLSEARWKADLESSSSVFAIFYDEMVLFFGAALLFLVAWLMRRNRNAKRLAEMALEDEAQGWDYDASRYPLPGER